MPKTSAASQDLETSAKLLRGGSFVDSNSERWIDVKNPATQDVVNTVPETTAEEFASAVKSANDAFPDWAITPVPHRQRIMQRFLGLINSHRDDLAHCITLEQGKTVADAHGDVFRGLEVS